MLDNFNTWELLGIAIALALLFASVTGAIAGRLGVPRSAVSLGVQFAAHQIT